jgi:uncharacterized protein involved in exopolysaccharide biosynthesis
MSERERERSHHDPFSLTFRQHGTLEIVRARLTMETRAKDEIHREMVAAKEQLRGVRQKYEKELEKLRHSHKSEKEFLAQEKKQLLDAKQSQERVSLQDVQAYI